MAQCLSFAEGSDEDKNDDEDEEEENLDAQEEAIPKDQLVVSADVSDMDYLKSRMTKALAVDEDEGEDAALELAQASQQSPRFPL